MADFTEGNYVFPEWPFITSVVVIMLGRITATDTSKS